MDDMKSDKLKYTDSEVIKAAETIMVMCVELFQGHLSENTFKHNIKLYSDKLNKIPYDSFLLAVKTLKTVSKILDGEGLANDYIENVIKKLEKQKKENDEILQKTIDNL